MAGAGSRFSKAGYKDPKPLIKINNVEMINLVIKNLRPNTKHRFIFICQRTHSQEYGLVEKLSCWAPGCEIVQIDGMTEGAACTVLKARHLIENDNPLMIANSDQYVDCSIDQYIQKLTEEKLDGLIMTMKANDPKWSFVGFDENGNVTRVIEKEVISDEATVGIYNFTKGVDFVQAADEMIEQDLRVNNEFYVAPVYNQMISMGKRIGVFNIGEEANGMYGLGIPDDLEKFKKLPVCKKILGKINENNFS